jgi:GntR family transcriptional repressor for pyruvate dehydrogenase complex
MSVAAGKTRPRAERPAPLQANGRKRGSKVAEEIARDILRKICEGGLKAGSQLPSEAQMVAEYGVGRGSFREALRILETHGLIRIKAGPGGGPVVIGPTTQDFGRMATIFFQSGAMTFRELIDARLLIEPVMARLAAQRRDPELIAQLLGQKTELDNDRVYLKSSADFHRLIGSMSGNRILNLFVHAIADVFHDRVVGMLFPPEKRGDVIRDHEAIARAIAKGDGTRAEKLMRAHMEDYARYVETRYPALMDEVIEWRP